MLNLIAERYRKHEAQVLAWFAKMQEEARGDPVYCSVDVRNSGYKIAPVDTNIFPAGFNNLCPSYRREAAGLFEDFFKLRYPTTKRILILAEEHTRNQHYFEHLYALRSILADAGFEAVVASLETPDSSLRHQLPDGNVLHMLRAMQVDGELTAGDFTPDLILANNDFSAGIPAALESIRQPLMPPPRLGWHTRKKSDHFGHYNRLAVEFANMLEIDPWLISAEFESCPMIDLGISHRRVELREKADTVLAAVREQHRKHGLKETPFVFIKNDAGTYGMAVMTAESGAEIESMNKKQRAHMKMGKGRQPVSQLIIQEGLPTVDRVAGHVAEPVIYLISNQIAGGFFRVHESADERSNLNQPGMKFTKLCFHEMTGYSNSYGQETSFDNLKLVYTAVARLASFAAAQEIRA